MSRKKRATLSKPPVKEELCEIDNNARYRQVRERGVEKRIRAGPENTSSIKRPSRNDISQHMKSSRRCAVVKQAHNKSKKWHQKKASNHYWTTTGQRKKRSFWFRDSIAIPVIELTFHFHTICCPIWFWWLGMSCIWFYLFGDFLIINVSCEYFKNRPKEQILTPQAREKLGIWMKILPFSRAWEFRCLS